MTPMNPDEALYAFVDGELELADEQHLFDALASHPELRTEMKDVLAIRNAVHRDVLFPSASAETEIMAAAGLTAPTSAAVVATSSNALSRFLYAGGGILAGVIAAYFLFDVGGTSQTLQQQQTMLENMARSAHQAELRMGEMQNEVRAGESPAEPVRVETLYVKVPAVQKNNGGNPLANATGPVAPDPLHKDGVDGYAQAPTNSIESQPLLVSTTPALPTATRDAAAMSTLLDDRRFRESNPLTPNAQEDLSSVRLRTLPSSLHGSNRIPASVNDAVLPNTSIALLMPVTSTERLGVEFGLDAFHQEFTAMRDGRPVKVDQTPVLYWIGGTFEYSPTWEPLIDGLRFYGAGTVGYAFSQGPVLHSMLGLQYQPAGPVRFTAGFDLAGLLYRDNTNWFFSKKMGFTYGLSVDIGKIE